MSNVPLCFVYIVQKVERRRDHLSNESLPWLEGVISFLLQRCASIFSSHRHFSTGEVSLSIRSHHAQGHRQNASDDERPLIYGVCKGNEPCTSYSRTFTIHNYGYGIAYTFRHNNITLEHTAMNDEEHHRAHGRAQHAVLSTLRAVR